MVRISARPCAVMRARPFPGSALPFLLARLKLGRHRDLEDFPVIRILDHLVPDAGRLVPGVSGLDADLPDVLKVELRPALDQVDHLEFELVGMVAHRPCAGLIGPNDVRQHLAFSGSLDAQVAVCEVGPQILAPPGILCVRRKRLSRLLGHGTTPFSASSSESMGRRWQRQVPRFVMESNIDRVEGSKPICFSKPQFNVRVDPLHDSRVVLLLGAYPVGFNVDVITKPFDLV